MNLLLNSFIVILVSSYEDKILSRLSVTCGPKLLVGTVQCFAVESYFMEPLFSYRRGSILDICILPQCDSRSSWVFLVCCIITSISHIMKFDWLSVWGYISVAMVIRHTPLYPIFLTSNSSLLSFDIFPTKLYAFTTEPNKKDQKSIRA